MNDNSVSKDQVECVSWWVVRGLLEKTIAFYAE